MTETRRAYPPVTVVVPTHNRATVLPHALDSILHQDGVETSVVVVDDASTSATAEVLTRYPTVQVLRNAVPVEQRRARNDGASLADTEWIAFCDDDDVWAPHKLQRQFDAAFAANADWVACSSLAVDETLAPVSGQLVGEPHDMVRKLARQNVIPGGGSGVLMRRQLFEAVGGFRTDAKYVEDWDLWVRLSQKGTLACVDELLVAQRQWSSSYSHQNVNAQRAAFVDMVARYADDSVGFGSRPRHVGSFELQRRLSSGSRRDLLRHLPRILVQSPEDWKFVAAVLVLPEAKLAQMRLTSSVGRHDIDAALAWLRSYGATPQPQDAAR